MAQKEHLDLLIRREGKVVLGKHCVNLWLLTAVLVATFASVAFSNGSKAYLNEKMNDPFTNWVNIEDKRQGEKLKELRDALVDSNLQQRFGYNYVQSDSEEGLIMFRHRSNNTDYWQIRFFERMNNPLMERVLDDENVVMGISVDPTLLQDDMLGFIVTQDALKKMGYSIDSVPAFIHYYAYSPQIDTLVSRGIVADKSNNLFYRAPLPILAVVRRLPMNMTMVTTKYFLRQYRDKQTFDMNHEKYFNELLYFVSEGKEDEFMGMADKAIPDSLKNGNDIRNIVLPMDEKLENRLRTWKRGKIYKICIGERDTPIQVYEDVAAQIEAEVSPIDICRVFDYKVDEGTYEQFSSLSLNFTTLDSIRAFEGFAKDKFNVQVEMSQVNSKENFNMVSVMADILSWALIVFAIVCIIIFLVNMLQSYFQKVKHNLGTFKAFGISSAELTQVYVLIILAIIFVAIILALLLTWTAQGALSLMGIMKDGTFNYLSLWEGNTFLAVVIIVTATLITVKLVIYQLLKQTPGDLIYDRN